MGSLSPNFSPSRSNQIIKMTEAAAATPKVKKTTKAKPKASHPPFKAMTKAALVALKESKGSSRQAILKYIMANYKLQSSDPKRVNSYLKAALLRGLKDGSLKNAKGKGVSGSFKLAEKPKAPKKAADKPKKAKSPKKKSAAKPKKAATAAKPKKSPAKKAAAKKPKVAKKPAAEKKPKAAKSPAKKAVAKKPKAAKKSPAKKAKAAKK